MSNPRPIVLEVSGTLLALTSIIVSGVGGDSIKPVRSLSKNVCNADGVGRVNGEGRKTFCRPAGSHFVFCRTTAIG